MELNKLVCNIIKCWPKIMIFLLNKYEISLMFDNLLFMEFHKFYQSFMILILFICVRGSNSVESWKLLKFPLRLGS